jgi:RimJ/RimL family protein N-acetyltransferase
LSAALVTDPRARATTGGLLIRELASADRFALVFMFSRLGEPSRYQRFLAIKPQLTSADLDFLTDVDHWHHEAVIAFSPPPRAPVGVARYVRSREFDLAEVAVTVVDDWQRRGVGIELMLALRERALRAGIGRFTAMVLRDNRGALRLARRFGTTRAVSGYGALVELAGSWR